MTTAVSIATSPAPAASNLVQTAAQVIASNMTTSISLFGYEINLMTMMIIAMMIGFIFLAHQIQRSNRLDFADMITKDGRSVSLTKVLQLIGGFTATWIMIKLTLNGTLTEAILGIYLTYVAGVEGYSKFVAAKYGYNEKSIKDGASAASDDGANIKPSKDQ